MDKLIAMCVGFETYNGWRPRCRRRCIILMLRRITGTQTSPLSTILASSQMNAKFNQSFNE